MYVCFLSIVKSLSTKHSKCSKMLNSTFFFKFIKMSKSTKSSKRAKMLKLKNYRSVAKSVSLKHLSISKCLSLQNPLRTECACSHFHV